MDCFHEGANFLAIDPDECIDCALCVPECPAEAIFAEDDVPDGQRKFIVLNATLAKVWPVIAVRREPLAELRLQSLSVGQEAAVVTTEVTGQFLKNVASQGRSSIRLALPLVGVNVPRMRYEYGELGRAWPTA